MTASKIEAWIKAGYDVLASEGPDAIKVERLAKILNLNKSGFYYYFGTMESYFRSLIDYHVRLARGIAVEISGCNNIDPDLLLLIVKHKMFFLVEAQLLVKSNLAHVDQDFDEAGKIVNDGLLPLWRKTSDLPEDLSVSIAYLNMIRHFFYARIDPENMNYEFLHALSVETRIVLDKVILERRASTNDKGRPAPADK